MRKFKKRIDLAMNGSSSTSYCKRPLDAKEIQMVNEAVNKRLPGKLKSYIKICFSKLIRSFILHLGIFGESIEQLMEVQSKRWPDRQLPWVLVTLR